MHCASSHMCWSVLVLSAPSQLDTPLWSQPVKALTGWCIQLLHSYRIWRHRLQPIKGPSTGGMLKPLDICRIERGKDEVAEQMMSKQGHFNRCFVDC